MDVIRFYKSTKRNYVEDSRFWSKSKAIFNLKKKKITQIFPSIPQCKLFMGPDCVETLPIVSLLSNIV